MDDQELAATVPLLAHLNADVIDRVAAQFSLTRIEAGVEVMRQGDPGDSMHIVRSGRVEIELDGEIVRTQGRGAVIGELALLGGGVRTATVRAVRDTELLTLSRTVFDHLLETEPSFARALIHELSERVPRSDLFSAPARAGGVVAVVASQPGLPVADLARAFIAALRESGTVTSLDESPDPASWAQQLDTAERASRWVVLVCDRSDSEWSAFCQRQADRVLAVVDAARGIPESAPRSRTGDLDLVLVGGGSAAWLDRWQPRTHHLIARESFAADSARLARRISGRAVGLVLSGGGARGLAHIGVLQALQDAGIVIDRLGGTSMGAFVAGLAATGLTASQIRATARQELVERNPFRDYAWPRHSLIRAGRAGAMLDRVFADALIEEQPRSTFFVSTDLVAATEVIHRRGRLAEKVGLSMLLPGVAPPRWVGTALHVDGGVLNNLPVDVMAADGEGPVIAVDVMRPFGPPPGTAGARLPSVVDTIARSMVLGSWRKAESSRGLAKILIVPKLDGVAMFDFGRLDEIVRLGREAAERALAESGWSG